MKIVTYEEFVRMPAGTLFAPWKPCNYENPIAIKTDTGYGRLDWKNRPTWYFNGVATLAPFMPDYPDTYGIYESEIFHYDGDSYDYEEYQMFAVLEEHEVRRLLHLLEWALGGCKGEYDEDDI